MQRQVVVNVHMFDKVNGKTSWYGSSWHQVFYFTMWHINKCHMLLPGTNSDLCLGDSCANVHADSLSPQAPALQEYRSLWSKTWECPARFCRSFPTGICTTHICHHSHFYAWSAVFHTLVCDPSNVSSFKSVLMQISSFISTHLNYVIANRHLHLS